MDAALQIRTGKLYSRHAAAADRGNWSMLRDVRWGDIDVPAAQSHPELLLAVRRLILALSVRNADSARLLGILAGDPHASAALTLDLWDGLKHLHALRTYLDAVDFAPRLTDEEVAAVRRATTSDSSQQTEGLVELFFTQHRTTTLLRNLGARAVEPVLAELLALVAADVARHAQVIGDLLALRISAGASSAEAVRAEAHRLRHGAVAGGGSEEWPADDKSVQAFMRRIDSLCESATDRATHSSSSPLSRT